MAGLTNALVTGQNFADKSAPETAALAGGATLADVIAALNALTAQLKANGLIK